MNFFDDDGYMAPNIERKVFPDGYRIMAMGDIIRTLWERGSLGYEDEERFDREYHYIHNPQYMYAYSLHDHDDNTVAMFIIAPPFPEIYDDLSSGTVLFGDCIGKKTAGGPDVNQNNVLPDGKCMEYIQKFVNEYIAENKIRDFRCTKDSGMLTKKGQVYLDQKNRSPGTFNI